MLDMFLFSNARSKCISNVSCARPRPRTIVRRHGTAFRMHIRFQM